MEFQVNASHQLALITSLPFVHTARRYPGLSYFEKSTDYLVQSNLRFTESELIAII
jgi:hypothetical protein